MQGTPGTPESPVSQAGSEDGFQVVIPRLDMPAHEPTLHEDGQPLRLEAVSPSVTPTTSLKDSPTSSPGPCSPATPARAPLADCLLKEENLSMQSEILRLQLKNDALAERLQLAQAENTQLKENAVARGLLLLRSLTRPVAASQLRGSPAHVPLSHACRQLCLAVLYILCAVGMVLFSGWRLGCHAATAAACTVRLCCAGVRAVARHIAAHSDFYIGLVVGAAVMAVGAVALATAAGVVTVPAIPRTLHMPVNVTRLSRAALNQTHLAADQTASASAVPAAGASGGGTLKHSKRFNPGSPAPTRPPLVEAEPTRWQLASTAVRLYLPPLQLASPTATASAADAAPARMQAAAGGVAAEKPRATASSPDPPGASSPGQQAGHKKRFSAALTAGFRRLFDGSSVLHPKLPKAVDNIAGALLGWPVGLFCTRGLMRLLQG
ncbi:hypothetical protein ACK3TF_001781 [Chlorella vulgaris]